MRIDRPRMNKVSFKAVLERLDLIHGIHVNENYAINLGMIAWDKIGNKETDIYRLATTIVDCKATLPCNAEFIECVTTGIETPANATVDRLYENFLQDEDFQKPFRHDLILPDNRFLKFRHFGEYLQFDVDSLDIQIIYRGVICDDDGLPLLTEKEVEAISYYIAYIESYKSAKNNMAGAGEMMQFQYSQWDRLCADARVPEEFTQNEIDRILDVKFSWDRKMYGKAYKTFR